MEITHVPDILHGLIHQWGRVHVMERETAGQNIFKLKTAGGGGGTI